MIFGRLACIKFFWLVSMAMWKAAYAILYVLHKSRVFCRLLVAVALAAKSQTHKKSGEKDLRLMACHFYLASTNITHFHILQLGGVVEYIHLAAVVV